MARAFTWEGATLSRNLKTFPMKLERAVVGAVEFHSTKAEAWARVSARWTDRTSNARNGLFTKTVHVPFVSHSIVVAHTVPYGVWLEVRWSGRYAVIIPTVKHEGAALMRTLNRLIERSVKT